MIDSGFMPLVIWKSDNNFYGLFGCLHSSVVLDIGILHTRISQKHGVWMVLTFVRCIRAKY
jgi:hypothetical protein